MLSVDEARARVLAAVEPCEEIDVALSDAPGMVSSRAIDAPHPLPPFDNSAMDGYAVSSADVAGAAPDAPVTLQVVDESRAGTPASCEVEPGTAVRIMTGAAVPIGADAIVVVEDTAEEGSVVTIRAPGGRHIRRAGEDLVRGDVALPAGIELGAGELALLAALGRARVTVRRRPRVALLVTGDELADAGAELVPGQIRDSNSIALRTLAEEAGAEVAYQRRVPDEWEAALDAFEDAGRNADLVVSSGGVAVGRYDLVRQVVEKLGEIDFWKVAMQPGKPVVLGSVGAARFMGLPGNPVSVHVSFEQFVRPAIRKMRGCGSLLRPRLRARIASEITKKPGRLHFVRVRLERSGDDLRAIPTGPQGSHIQSSLVQCDGLALFPLEAQKLEPDDEVMVEVWRLPE